MKKLKGKIKELKRITQVLESDRLGVSGDCKEVIKRDLKELLSNYFVLKGEVEVKIESSIKGFNLLIYAEGESFKGFKMVIN